MDVVLNCTWQLDILCLILGDLSPIPVFCHPVAFSKATIIWVLLYVEDEFAFF